MQITFSSYLILPVEGNSMMPLKVPDTENERLLGPAVSPCHQKGAGSGQGQLQMNLWGCSSDLGHTAAIFLLTRLSWL